MREELSPIDLRSEAALDTFIAGLDSPWHSDESRREWCRLFLRDAAMGVLRLAAPRSVETDPLREAAQAVVKAWEHPGAFTVVDPAIKALDAALRAAALAAPRSVETAGLREERCSYYGTCPMPGTIRVRFEVRYEKPEQGERDVLVCENHVDRYTRNGYVVVAAPRSVETAASAAARACTCGGDDERPRGHISSCPLWKPYPASPAAPRPEGLELRNPARLRREFASRIRAFRDPQAERLAIAVLDGTIAAIQPARLSDAGDTEEPTDG